jgi:hypothetical protein
VLFITWNSTFYFTVEKVYTKRYFSHLHPIRTYQNNDMENIENKKKKMKICQHTSFPIFLLHYFKIFLYTFYVTMEIWKVSEIMQKSVTHQQKDFLFTVLHGASRRPNANLKKPNPNTKKKTNFCCDLFRTYF